MELFTTFLEVLGAACVTVGAFLLAAWLGWVVAGVCLAGLGVLLGRDL